MGGFYFLLFTYHYFLSFLLHFGADLEGRSEARRHELLV